MKVHSYARDIKLNTKCGNTKIYSFITIIIIFFLLILLSQMFIDIWVI